MTYILRMCFIIPACVTNIILTHNWRVCSTASWTGGNGASPTLPPLVGLCNYINTHLHSKWRPGYYTCRDSQDFLPHTHAHTLIQCLAFSFLSVPFFQSVEGEHHEKAVELLKAAQGTVKLVVRYTPKVLEEMESRFEKMRSAKRRQQNNYPK